MINDRGVYWEVRAYNEALELVGRVEFNNAEAARKAARGYSLADPFLSFKLWKMDPVHGAVEIMP